AAKPCNRACGYRNRRGWQGAVRIARNLNTIVIDVATLFDLRPAIVFKTALNGCTWGPGVTDFFGCLQPCAEDRKPIVCTGDCEVSTGEQSQETHRREAPDVESGRISPAILYQRILVIPQEKYDAHDLKRYQVPVKPGIIETANDQCSEIDNRVRPEQPEDLRPRARAIPRKLAAASRAV